MDILEAIQGRRSIRSYKAGPISQDTLRSLVLESGIWAPSGGNIQAWRFVVVTSTERLRQIRMVSPGILSDTPAVIAICEDMSVMQNRGGPLGPDFLAIADASMAAQNIMLAAYGMGLGTCAIASFHRKGVQQILHLPEAIVPMLLLSVGTAATLARTPCRTKDVIWFDEYQANAI